MRFAHTSVTVKEMETSLEFYQRWLGLELDRRTKITANRAEIAFLRDPHSGMVLELTHWWDKEDWTEGDELDHLAFQVEDLPAFIQRCQKGGVTIAKQPYTLPGGTRQIAFILDPNGIWIELLEP